MGREREQSMSGTGAGAKNQIIERSLILTEGADEIHYVSCPPLKQILDQALLDLNPQQPQDQGALAHIK